MAGEIAISPGPPVYRGEYWQVEHAYPCGMKGWLVIVLRRHAEALHELSAEEIAELSSLIEKASRVLREVLGTEKEYLALFGEAEHFNHMHVHVVARSAELSPTLRGPAIFKMLKPGESEVVPPEEIRMFCEELQILFK